MDSAYAREIPLPVSSCLIFDLLIEQSIPAYVPPDPSQETCVHRYSFHLYQQRFYPLEFPEPPEYRSDFDLDFFVENVISDGGLCGPVASIEFKSRY